MTDIESTPDLSDDCVSDLNFPWLFDPDRFDHLPVEDQAKCYKQRSLRPGAVYRRAAKIWGAPRSRVRRFECHTIVEDVDRHSNDNDISEDDQAPGEERSDRWRQGGAKDWSRRQGNDGLINHSSSQDQGERSKWRSHDVESTDAHDVKPETVDVLETLRAWLEQRKKLRTGLENLGLNLDWLRNKPNKTAMERRVLGQLIDEKYPIKEEEESTLSPTLRTRRRKARVFPLKRSSPEAIRIIEELLYERQLRLIDLFQMVDKDKNWRLTRDEFVRAIHVLGLPLEEKHIDELISVFSLPPTYELDYRDMALCMSLWKNEKIENKKKRVHSASALVQTDELMRLTERDDDDDRDDDIYCRHGNDRSQSAVAGVVGVEGVAAVAGMGDSEEGGLAGGRSERRRARTSPTRRLVDTHLHVDSDMIDSCISRDMKDRPSDGLQPWQQHEQQLVRSGVKVMSSQTIITSSSSCNNEDDKNNFKMKSHQVTERVSKEENLFNTGEQAPVTPVTTLRPTGDVAIDNHCAPSTLGGSTAESVNKFRQEMLTEYLEIGRICNENNVTLSVPILQKALLYYADKQHADIIRELSHKPFDDPYMEDLYRSETRKSTTTNASHLQSDNNNKTLTKNEPLLQSRNKGDANSKSFNSMEQQSLGPADYHRLTTSTGITTTAAATAATKIATTTAAPTAAISRGVKAIRTDTKVSSDQSGGPRKVSSKKDLTSPTGSIFPPLSLNIAESSRRHDDTKTLDTGAAYRSHDYTRQNQGAKTYRSRRDVIERRVKTAEDLSTGRAMIGVKVDTWMTFEEYSKFCRDMKTRSKDEGRHMIRVRSSTSLLDKMRLWMPHKDEDEGNAIFYRAVRARPQLTSHGGGLAAWQINQSGYIQYGTIEK